MRIPETVPLAHHLDVYPDGSVRVIGGGLKGWIANRFGGGGVSLADSRYHDDAQTILSNWEKRQEEVKKDPTLDITDKMVIDRHAREAQDKVKKTDKSFPPIYRGHQENR